MRKLQFIVFGLILLCGQTLFGNIINVPDDYPTIQQGIDASVNGDTILVKPGTYVENINYNGKNITVASWFLTTQDTSYISQTIIDGNQNGSVVTFENGEDSTAVLCGFTITNGLAQGDEPHDCGGGVFCDNSNPFLYYLIICNNIAVNDGGGIFCQYDSNLTLLNVTVTSNSSDSWGGGICCNYNSSPNMENVIITDNSVTGPHGSGGGISCFHYSFPTLVNAAIMGNWAHYRGGGIYCYYSSMSLQNVAITNNNATNEGGGVYCTHNSNHNMENVIIAGNSANYGGGIYCMGSNPSLENVMIKDNSADYGGGLYCIDNSSPNLEEVTITDNIASENGGGICCWQNSSPSFHNLNRCNIYCNQITNSKGYGADIFSYYSNRMYIVVDTFTVLNPSDYYASPIDNMNFDILHGKQDTLINSDLYVSIDGDDSNSGTTPDEPLKTIGYALSIIYTDISNHNTIHLLPGIYSSDTNGEVFPIEWSNYVSLEGIDEEEIILDADSLSGVLRFHYITESNIKNITLRNGSSENGGGIYCYYSSPSLENITIIGNHANIGGGICCSYESNPSLENITITGNSASSNGGGIYCNTSSSPNLNDVAITDNVASENGGGICCWDNSSPSLENVIIMGNSASHDGGGIYCSYSNPVLSNVTISDNSAISCGGGVCCQYYSNPSFDNINRCNISLNFAALSGNDLYAYDCQTINIIVDTFTVIQPDDYFAYPIDDFTFDIQNAKVVQVNQDLYVNPDGSDENSGLLPEEPLLTISYALIKIIPDTINPHTIHLVNGTYSPSHTGEIFPLNCRSHVSIIGEDQTLTNLDGEGLSSILYCNDDNYFSMENITIKNGNAPAGGGIYCNNSSPSLENIIITGNSATTGGGICCSYESNPCLDNVTIADNSASERGGGIYCYNNSNPNLENIAIIDNSANSHGGGIYCDDNSSPTLVFVSIINNSADNCGGGIFCRSYSNLSLENVTIAGNSSYYLGGGIYSYITSPSLENVTIAYNSASYDGGGIYCYHSNPVLENSTIRSNSATNYGGGIYFGSNSSPSFHNEHRCNIYLNNITNSKGYGTDIFAYNCDTIHVIVDTFTVFNPSDHYTSPIDNFTFDILHSFQDSLINADLYVSVDGNDSNIGTSPEEPLKTIRCALTRIYADSLNNHTIHLLPGVYSPSTNGEEFPLEWINYVSLDGCIESDCILDGDSLSGVMRFRYVTDAVISNITIRNGSADFTGGGIYSTHSSPILENVTIISSSAIYGGGISCYSSSLSLVRTTITSNSATYGGGIYCSHSSLRLTNITIADNYAYDRGGGIGFYQSNPIIENVTITGNSATYGGGFYCWNSCGPILKNCILWNDNPEEVFFTQFSDPNMIEISYSDIDGDSAGIVTNNNGTINWLEGNIDSDPLFVDPENGDYHLSWANFPIPDSTMSPCIDAGDPDPQYNDPDGTRNDMGAYYFDQTVGVDDENNTLIETGLFQNYPNPFNKITTIRYFLPKYSEVKIQIYNLKGQLVETIVDSNKPTGYYTVEWNSKGMSSGIYFYKLSTKDKTFIKKMILLK